MQGQDRLPAYQIRLGKGEGDFGKHSYCDLSRIVEYSIELKGLNNWIDPFANAIKGPFVEKKVLAH